MSAVGRCGNFPVLSLILLTISTAAAQPSSAPPSTDSLRRTAWMKQARWGVMTHYLADWQARTNNLEMSVEQWNKMVDGFDAEGLADQLKAVGAGYQILTIGQNSGYYLAPNPTYDRLTGIRPSKCSRRDLVSDMAAALARHGIKLIVYLPSGAPAGDRLACEALQWQNGMYPNREFQTKWEQIIADWSKRFGDKVAGWWFDGCYWPNVMYRSPEPPNFESLAAAARSGNPSSAIAFNPGVVPRLISTTPHEDYTAGEISNPERLEIRRSVDGILDGKQVHVLTYLGRTWGMGEPRFTAEQPVQFSQNVWQAQGAITWDVPVAMNGRISEPFIALLKTIAQASGRSTLPSQDTPTAERVAEVLRDNILAQAAWAMKQQPATITQLSCSRSAGGKHDFYSEGDYWWPDPEHPDGPYIQRDGMTNPDNFVAHRQAMIRLSRIVGSLASAYRITGDAKYVRQGFQHVESWFVNPATMMNPSLEYAQAIKGRATGRGIGIIDTIHLMEVAQGLRVMEKAPGADARVSAAAKDWFRQYLKWLTTHQYGEDEMNAKNNHGTCWVMQVASFARLTGDQALMDRCRERFKTVLLPDQMAPDGSFPLELRRTKPYGYSLFNLDAMAMICHILSDESHDLWNYQTPDGKSVGKAISFLFPYVADKTKWPYAKDVMYWNEWPVAHPFLVFGALRFGTAEWFRTWVKLNHAPEVEEVLRNLPVRNPVIWID